LVPEYVHEFEKELSNLIGIPSDKIISSTEYRHIIADKVIASSHPRTATYGIRKSTAEFLRKKFQNVHLVYNTYKKYPKKFFISRKDAPRRKVINEEDLSQMLEVFGIETIQIKDYTFQEIIYLFRNSEVIISPHSAALTNMIFCSNKLVSLFEIFPTQDILPYYYELAAELNIEYNIIIIENTNDYNIKSRYDIQDKDIFIDLNILFDSLKKHENLFN